MGCGVSKILKSAARELRPTSTSTSCHCSQRRPRLFQVMAMPLCSSLTASSRYSSRRALTTPAGLATQVQLDVFLDRVLPPLPHGLKLSLVIENLLTVTKKKKRCMPVTQQGRLRGFANDPAVSSRSEETSFLNLKRAVSRIIKDAVRSGYTPTTSLEFYNNASCVMQSAARTSTCLPDSYLSRDGTHTWSSIVVCGEHKKTGTDADIFDVSLLLFGREWSRH